VGREGAVCASDQGWGVAIAAVDGGQWWRRRSGEGVSSGKRKCCGLGVLGGVKQVAEQQLSTPKGQEGHCACE
jgi:hypothetical protein